MTEVFETNRRNAVPKTSSVARRSGFPFAALAGLAMLASPIQAAFGAAPVAEVRIVDDPGRIAYQSQLFISKPQTLFKFPAVPAGHRLVVQHVSGTVFFQSTVSDAAVSVGTSDSTASSFLPPFLRNGVEFDQPVQLYVDAGNAPEVRVEANGGDALISDGIMTLTGYLLDCTAAPCAKIAH